MSNWWEEDDLNKALDEAEADDRVGDHTVVVDAVEHRNFDGGREGYNCTCLIETARFSKFYVTFGAPRRSGEELKAMKETAKDDADMRQYRAASSDMRAQQMLAKEYGLADAKDIGKGFRFAAKLVKNKKGYIRVAAILPKSKMAGETPAPSKDAPF